jgi:tetratricopeptide (TPR) repeat protein
MDGQTLDSLADMVCGDGQNYPVYRSGSELTRFFNRVGFSNFRHDGSTRKWWALGVLKQLTENNLKAVVLRLADPREYRGNEAQVGQAVGRLNEILMVEGLKVELDGVTPRLKEITPQFVPQPEEPKLKPLPPPDFLNLKLGEALTMIDKALAYQPENSVFMDTKGWILFRMGKKQEAKLEIEKSLALNPECKDTNEHYKLMAT